MPSTGVRRMTITQQQKRFCTASMRACNCLLIWRCALNHDGSPRFCARPKPRDDPHSVPFHGELNKGARRPAHVPATAIKQVGILGAGFMGPGIAYVTASAGMDVVLIDQIRQRPIRARRFATSLSRGKCSRPRTGAIRKRFLPDKTHRRLHRLAGAVCDRSGFRGSRG